MKKYEIGSIWRAFYGNGVLFIRIISTSKYYAVTDKGIYSKKQIDRNFTKIC